MNDKKSKKIFAFTWCEAAKKYIDLNCNIHTKHQHQYGHKQESIPVGCVPPTFVVCGGKVYLPDTLRPHTLPSGYPHPLNTPPPNTLLQIPSSWKGHETRDTLSSCQQIDTCEDITFHQLLLRTVKIKWVLDQFKSVNARASADAGCETQL